jgi:hypothetical protein
VTTPTRQPQRIAAAWFLGACALALLVLACLRGAGRLVFPLLLVVVLGAIVARLVRKVREPLP